MGRDWPLEIGRIRSSWTFTARNTQTVEQQHNAFIEAYGASKPRF
jgi:hypothetical protein